MSSYIILSSMAQVTWNFIICSKIANWILKRHIYIYICCYSGSQPWPTLWNPWTAAHQTSLSLTISWSLPKFMFVALAMPSNHLTLWCLPLLLPSIFPSIRDFSNESYVCIRWPKYWSYTFYIYRYKIKIQFKKVISKKFKNRETRLQ